jgi:hypothetical protein
MRDGGRPGGRDRARKRVRHAVSLYLRSSGRKHLKLIVLRRNSEYEVMVNLLSSAY